MQKEAKAREVSRRQMVTTATTVPLVQLAVANAADVAGERAFTRPQLRIVEAFVERLIPSDEHGPGARESGVATYIDRSFAGVLAKERGAFSAGLASVDVLAHRRHGAAFADLNATKQDEVLTAMENNEAEGFVPNSRAFFLRMRQLTLEGMFGDPYYGGNRGFAGWDLIRYPGPRMAVSAEEQKLRDPIKPLRRSARGGRHGD
ncbi:MAG: gluconate 2-dehydrogenase subunit 3 family protein [Acidobacteriota bacterium]